MNQRAFWNTVAATKTFSHPLDVARFSSLVSREASVLDYGCGYGRVCRELRSAGYSNIIGVDPSSAMIDRARAENPGITFQILDSDTLPFMAAPFDAVLLFSVLTCIVDDGEQHSVVREIERALRRGGILYVSDILLQEDDRNRERYDTGVRAFGRYGVFELEPGVRFRHLPRAWVEELMSGFVPLDFVEIEVTTMNGNPAKAFQYWGAKR
ncbi:MAG: class I SAM-dependent methyltransferase [Acidobacteria bacterium]|nr:class I SAM-dependent methyltransferase [Acidobacteriota bacterium]